MLDENTEQRNRFKYISGGIRARWAAAVLIAVACVALIALEASHIVKQRDDILAAAGKDAANLADALVEHAELTFRVADALLIEAVERLEHEDLGPEGRERLKSWFRQEASRSSQFTGFTVIDREGAIVVNSFADDAKENFSDREYFIYHRTHAEREFHIGAPIVGRVTKDWLIPVTSRLDRADGTFGGVVVAAINPRYFQGFYDRLEIGKSGSVLLASVNGKLLVRRPFAEADVGRDISQSRTFGQLQLEPAGTAEITASSDGVTRLNGYQRGRSYPIVVVVSKDKAELLAPWRQDTIQRIGEIIVVVLVISLIGRFAWRATKTLSAEAIKLHKINDRFDAAINSMSHGLCIYGPDKRIIVANRQYAEIYRLSSEQICPGTHLADVFRYRAEKGTGFPPASDIYGPNPGGDPREVHELRDGRVISIVRHNMRDGGLLSIHEDITARAHSERKIAYLAEHDQLTGLPNRHHFAKFLADAAASGNGPEDGLAVLMVDLDRFKAVNDMLGHGAGDLLLSAVAERLRICTRETDLVARLGGDEFAIIQNIGSNDHEVAIALARRIIEAISQPFELDGKTVNVGASVGVALCPEHDRPSENLMRKADLALYAAKAAGKNDFRIYHPRMSDSDDLQKQIERELREALQRGEFELYYQPVVNLATGAVCGAEALIWWRHPTRGLLAPDLFIPLAESRDLIVAIGEWILQKACSDAVAWREPLKVAVNISALLFTQGNLFNVVLSTLVDTGLSPTRLELELELTESVLLDQESNHAETIRQLRNVGITVVMEDFGTGYSSASNLTNFAFGKIKLDKWLVQGMTTRKECAAVIASKLALAKGLGIETTAEGVETSEQMEWLRAAGVTYGQGYYFGRPQPNLAIDASEHLYLNIA